MEDHCQSVDTQAPFLKKSIIIKYYANMHCGQLVDIDIQNTAHGMFKSKSSKVHNLNYAKTSNDQISHHTNIFL